MMSPNEVQAMMKKVETLFDGGYKLYIAGGYLRDIHNNLSPKDVDIMVVPQGYIYDPDDFGEMIVSLEDYTVEKTFIHQCQYMSDMLERGVGGLVMGSMDCGTDVQFIIYDNFMSQQEITDDMDMNCNQITMDSDGQSMTSPEYTKCFEDKHIKILHSYSEARKVSRMKRMMAKFPDFTNNMGI